MDSHWIDLLGVSRMEKLDGGVITLKRSESPLAVEDTEKWIVILYCSSWKV